MTDRVTVSHIVAMTDNGVIGKDGKLPWHIPEDLQQFKEKTMGKTMLMGRKTYESIGKPLPGRLSLVVTRQVGWQPQSAAGAPAKAFPSVEAAMAYALGESATWGSEVFVIGGGQVYAETLAIADRIYQTLVHQKVDGDTRYPDIDPAKFWIESSRPGKGSVPHTFRTLTRRRIR